MSRDSATRQCFLPLPPLPPFAPFFFCCFRDDVMPTLTKHGIVVSPSATLLFHPVVREVKRIVDQELGPLAGD